MPTASSTPKIKTKKQTAPAKVDPPITRKRLPYPERGNGGDLLALDSLKLADSAQHDAVFEAASHSSLHEVFKRTAEALGLLKTEVCLVHLHTIRREGQKTVVLYPRSIFNPGLTAMVKETGEARFDDSRKSWNVVASPEHLDTMSKGLPTLFKAIIQLDPFKVYLTDCELKPSIQAAFDPLPYHVNVNDLSILHALSELPYIDYLERSFIRIHDGTSFIRFPDQCMFQTRSPFLLLRIAFSKNPRYISYSTLGNCIEDVTYQNASRNLSAKYIARYIDSLDAGQIEAFVLDGKNLIAEEPGMREAFKGSFLEFQPLIDKVQSVFPGLEIAPLCNHYTSMTYAGHGSDARPSEWLAYVAPQELGALHQSHLRKIAEHFSHGKECLPIVFNREYLKKLDPQTPTNAEDFLCTLTHELAHHFLMFQELEVPSEYQHGYEWCLNSFVLNQIFGLPLSDFFHGHSDPLLHPDCQDDFITEGARALVLIEEHCNGAPIDLGFFHQTLKQAIERLRPKIWYDAQGKDKAMAPAKAVATAGANTPNQLADWPDTEPASASEAS